MAYSSLFTSFFHQKRKSESESHSVVSNSLQLRGLYSPWNSPGQNTGVGSLSLLQGIFPTQELNWGLPHSRQILYQLSYQGSPKHQFFTLSLLYGPALTSIHESESHPVMTDSLRRHGLYSPWTSVGQNTRVSSLSLLQGIFPTQGLNPGLLHCRHILYQLGHKGSPFFSCLPINYQLQFS